MKHAPTLLLLPVLTLLSLHQRAIAQYPHPSQLESIGGTTYYIAFPDTVTNQQDSRFPPGHPEHSALLIYTPVAQTITVTGPNGLVKQFPLPPGEMYELDIDLLGLPVPFITEANRPVSGALKVEAESNVVIYAYTSVHSGGGAYTPLPVSQWGEEYYVASWPGSFVVNVRIPADTIFRHGGREEAPAEIIIVAAENNTQVIITPTAPLADCNSCTTVRLNAGESYMVRSRVDTSRSEDAIQPDIAGTQIRSNRPIGVIGANSRTTVQPVNNSMLTYNSIKDLTMEWIRPVTHHGTDFVFMPTLDRVPYNTYWPERDAEYVRFYPTGSELTTVGWKNENGYELLPDSPLSAGSFAQEELNDTTYNVHGTDAHVGNLVAGQPGMAFQSPKSMPQMDPFTGGEPIPPLRFFSSGTYMVEMMPREAWVRFAPFRAPALQTGARHFINLAADSLDRHSVYYVDENGDSTEFQFDQGVIPGTSIVWGIDTITSGRTYRLFGKDGARFGGFVYGTWRGYEAYRPQGTERKGEDGATIAGGANGALHPAEYEENIGQMYGYPLPADHHLTPLSTSLRLSSSEESCGAEIVVVRKIGESDPVSIRLLPDSSSNVRIEWIEPSGFTTGPGIDRWVFRLQPFTSSSSMTSTGIVEVIDAAGGVYHYSYSYTLDPIITDPDFYIVDDTSSGVTSVARYVIPNRTTTPIRLRDVWIWNQDPNFTIIGTEPSFQLGQPDSLYTIRPGDSVVVLIGYRKTQAVDTGRGFMQIDFECVSPVVSLFGISRLPCIVLDDIDFGQVRQGETKSLPLTICNVGSGTVEGVTSLPALKALVWNSTAFTISNSDLNRIRAMNLRNGQCLEITVTAHAPQTLGTITTTGRINASTSNCRDTTIWRMVVVDTVTGVERDNEQRGRLALNLRPNPSSGRSIVEFTLPERGPVELILIDANGREIARPFEQELAGGRHSLPLEMGGLPSGVYYLRLRAGGREESRGLYIVR